MEKNKPDKIKDFLTYFLVERNNAGNEKWEQSLQRQNIVPHQSNDSYAVCFTKLALNSLLSLSYIFFFIVLLKSTCLSNFVLRPTENICLP